MLTLLRMLDDDAGATAVEYAIIASLIAGVIGLIVALLGQKTAGMLTVTF